MKNSKNSEHSKASEIGNDDPNYNNYRLNPTIKTIMIKEAFQMFDTDSSGEIDTNEFEKLVMSLGLELDRAKIKELYKRIDSDMSGSIDEKEFTNMMLELQFSNNPQFVYSHLLNTFNKLDIDCDGYIDKYDLVKASEEIDTLIVNMEEMEELIKLIKWSNKDKTNINNDRISRDEFIKALNNFGFIQEMIYKKDNDKSGTTDTPNNDEGNYYSERDKFKPF